MIKFVSIEAMKWKVSMLVDVFFKSGVVNWVMAVHFPTWRPMEIKKKLKFIYDFQCFSEKFLKFLILKKSSI